jgi:hypothetical protein
MKCFAPSARRCCNTLHSLRKPFRSPSFPLHQTRGPGRRFFVYSWQNEIDPWAFPDTPAAISAVIPVVMTSANAILISAISTKHQSMSDRLRPLTAEWPNAATSVNRREAMSGASLGLPIAGVALMFLGILLELLDLKNSVPPSGRRSKRVIR